MRGQFTTTIADVYGEPHQYFLVQHGGIEGARLLGRLAKIASGPLGALGLQVAGGGSAGEATVDPAKALREAFDAIVAEGTDSLFLEILKHTMRDSRPVTEAFNTAYQGNYFELFEAIWFALKSNFGESLKRVPFAQTLVRPTQG